MDEQQQQQQQQQQPTSNTKKNSSKQAALMKTVSQMYSGFQNATAGDTVLGFKRNEAIAPIARPDPEAGVGNFPFIIDSCDQDRLSVLRNLEILDTPPDISFDNITSLCSNLLKVPICLVSLVDEKRQWFKSRHGLDVNETGRDVSLCNFVVQPKAADIVQIMPLLDDVLKHSPLCQSLPIHFYAGASLVIDGHKVGALCVIDQKPRAYLNEMELSTLRSLAKCVVDLLSLHRLNQLEKKRAKNLAKEKKLLLNSLASMNTTGAILLERTGENSDPKIVYGNATACKLFGITEEELVARSLKEVVVGQHTRQEDFDKLRGAVILGQNLFVVLQSDRNTLLGRVSQVKPHSFWARYTVTVLNTENSSPGKYILVEVSDETSLANLGTELEQTKHEALNEIESRKILILNLAREVRARLTPMNHSIRGLLSTQQTQETKSVLEKVNEGTQYLIRLAETVTAHELSQVQPGNISESRKRPIEASSSSAIGSSSSTTTTIGGGGGGGGGGGNHMDITR